MIGTVAGHLTAIGYGWPLAALAAHYHDTYGQALANIHASLECGVAVYDSSIAGLGGCPYAPGASGNISSEDAIHMLEAMGCDTGVDMARLLEAARALPAIVGHEVPGQVARAGPTSQLHPAPAAVAELRAAFS